ncbi:MAG TPA: hypothetical protein VHC90_21460 [Bryobacteraceae bacterium]|nr:hypothetical protein [Bryobacteraceae bacterium]
MRLCAAALILVLAASFTYGQAPANETTTQEPLEAAVIHVNTLTGDSFDRLVNLLRVFKASVQADSQLRTIVVYAPKDVVAQMKRVIAELDTPGSDAAIGRNIEMTLTLLRCSQKAPASGAKLPDDMESVAKQLRAATQYKDIQLWDTIPLRLQEGKETSETMELPGTADPLLHQPTVVSLRLDPEAATRKGEGWSVRFRRVSLDFRIPVVTGTFSDGSKPQFTYQNVGLDTSGDFVEGQKTVLGKISGVESDSTIFAVVSLKVLQ